MKLILAGVNMTKTVVAKIETFIDKRIIRAAIKIMKHSGVIIYPTETCYGLGCDATNIKAINKIYKIKKRVEHKPLPVIVSSLGMINKYAEISKTTKYMVKKFMPGPLTIIVKMKKNTLIGLKQESIGFRISSHPVALLLVKEVGRPIIATSANTSGKPPLYKINDVIKTFNKKVDMILDYGDLKEVEPSTCVDMFTDTPKIIREGPISREEIMNVLKLL